MKLSPGTPCLTAAGMQALEQAAITGGGVSGWQLMTRAGEGAAKVLLGRYEPGSRAVVLCGPGNNGGDGYVIARLLSEAGWSVSTWAEDPEGRLPEDAARARSAWAVRGPVGALRADTLEDLPEADVYIDALFGLGLSRPLEGVAEQVVAELRRRAGKVVAVDIPSGLGADTGRAVGGGPVVRADLTVTFHSPKPGHFLADGPATSGALEVIEIGLGPFHDKSGDSLHLQPPYGKTDFRPPRDRADLARVLRKAPGHKYDHGAALVLSGGVGKGGAARMSARAALRIGAGLVTLGVPPAAVIENAAQLDAVMLARIPDAEALSHMLEEDDRISALALGPGMGLGEREAALVAAALAARRATVLDADALTLLSRSAEDRQALHEDCLLTPHGGEFARLFPDISDRMKQRDGFSKVDAVRKAAASCGATVLLKGPDTVIASPDGAAAIASSAYSRSAPWLGTAGAGDVLTGINAGLMARGLSPFDAAQAAAIIHVDAALSFGPGLIAEDLPDLLPAALRALPL